MNKETILSHMIMYYVADMDEQEISFYEDPESSLEYDAYSYCVEHENTFKRAIGLVGYKGFLFNNIFDEIKTSLNCPEIWKSPLK